MAKKEVKGDMCSCGPCPCMVKMGIVKGVVLLVLAVLLLWQRWGWFNLEHTIALVMLLFGIKFLVKSMCAGKCCH